MLPVLYFSARNVKALGMYYALPNHLRDSEVTRPSLTLADGVVLGQAIFVTLNNILLQVCSLPQI